jgi:hypothetical protein
LSGWIKAGLDQDKEQKEGIPEYVKVIVEVAGTLEPGTEDICEREEKFEALIDQFEATNDSIRQGDAQLPRSDSSWARRNPKRSETISISSDGCAYSRITSGEFNVR